MLSSIPVFIPGVRDILVIVVGDLTQGQDHVGDEDQDQDHLDHGEHGQHQRQLPGQLALDHCQAAVEIDLGGGNTAIEYVTYSDVTEDGNDNIKLILPPHSGDSM